MGRAPGQAAGDAQPLDVLVDHGVDDVHEGLVAGEQPVPAGEQVALQPALAGVFGEDLHHPAVPVEVLVDRQGLRLPGLAGGVVDGLQPVGGGLVRADEPEVAALGGVVHDAAPAGRRGPGWARAGSRRACRRGRRTASSGGQRAGRAAAARRWRAGWRRGAGRPRGRRPGPARAGGRRSSKSSSGRYERSHVLQLPQVLRVLAYARPAGPGGRARCPRRAAPSTSAGPVQPLGVRSTIIGQRGALGRRRPRGRRAG